MDIFSRGTTYVCYGSLADIKDRGSWLSALHPKADMFQHRNRCPLSANSGHGGSSRIAVLIGRARSSNVGGSRLDVDAPLLCSPKRTVAALENVFFFGTSVLCGLQRAPSAGGSLYCLWGGRIAGPRGETRSRTKPERPRRLTPRRGLSFGSLADVPTRCFDCAIRRQVQKPLSAYVDARAGLRDSACLL